MNREGTEIKALDGETFRRILVGGANGIRSHIDQINELNVFPVPDGDTGTNMSRTIESGVARISTEEHVTLSRVANDFAKGSLFGARGNSGVILSQFFAGLCEAIADKETVSAEELAEAYRAGVERSYAAVVNPVEGTILTVFRESAEYAESHLREDSTPEDFLKWNVEEAERSLERTRDILPVLSEADVVDSGGAGYLCIAKGMYETLRSGEEAEAIPLPADTAKPEAVDYDLFDTDSVLTYGYCTECLVRLQRAKGDPRGVDEKAIADELCRLGCDSIVALKDGDVLKLHAHTRTPSDVLTLCQRYGEFLNLKIENMNLQHSEREAEKAEKKARKPRQKYGVVTVATGDGLRALFESLGADAVIHGGQTGNPSAEQFLAAFRELNAEQILVLPNNSNILLTARQAAELWEGGNVTVIPSKTVPAGYAALSVFNGATPELADQIADMTDAMEAVVSGEVTVAIRDSSVDGRAVKEGDYIGILEGHLVSNGEDAFGALRDMIEGIEDLDMRELLTLFVGGGVSEEARVEMTERLCAAFPDLCVEVLIGGQEIYDYLIAVE